MFKKLYAALICLLLCSVIFSGCATVQAADLMAGITQSHPTGRNADEQFISAQMSFATELFKKAANREQNSLISPFSVQLALAMTANGENGKTLAEMEAALGGLPIETLNEYLYGYVQSLPSEKKCKLQTANSIWFRDTERLTVEKSFLQTNADYYGAQAYKSPFNEQTVKDVNLWIKQKTDGMIPEMLQQPLSEDTQMLLINAVAFDGEWQNKYKDSDIDKGVFTSLTDKKRNVSMMKSNEIRYLNDGKAEGFIKEYSGGKYFFAALLPYEGTDLWEYVSSLTGESLLKTLKEAETCNVEATIPKFSCEYGLNMKDVLNELGMPTALDGSAADFSKLGHSDNGNLYIESVLHKTHIDITEKGSKAGAATIVFLNDGGSSAEVEITPQHRVILNRPFLYLIADAQTNLPVFIGTVTDIA